MNDVETLQSAIDDLETGLDAGPDLVGIRAAGQRLHRRRRLVQGVGLAAAATTVVVLGLGPVIRGDSTPAVGSPTSVTAVGSGHYVALSEPGWQVTYVEHDHDFSEVQYGNGGQEVDITEYPSSAYDSYYADRQDIGDGQPLDVLGLSGTTWAYSGDDHTVIRTPADGHFIEVRGSGMDADAFRVVLDRLTFTDQAGFGQAMPSGAVTPDNHDQAINRLLQGVGLPPGFTAADIGLQGFNDAYQASAQVAGQVGCAWIGVYDGGSAANRQAAIAAFQASRHWRLLLDIEHQGAYAQGFWSVADQLAHGFDQGTSLADLEQSICS